MIKDNIEEIKVILGTVVLLALIIFLTLRDNGLSSVDVDKEIEDAQKQEYEYKKYNLIYTNKYDELLANEDGEENG